MPDARLNMIYSLIPECRLLCDVGTDHCKLAVYAVEQGRARAAVATDLRRGPLGAAAKTVERHGLSDKITLLLSDGFLNIPEDLFSRTDCFVCAGMGGELIETIIRGRHTEKTLVLQPQSAVYELCGFLCENGYYIEKRVFCRDGDKIYTALLCRFDGARREYDPFAGAVRDGVFRLYLERERARIDRALCGISRGENADEARKRELEALRDIIISEINHENS